MLLSGESETVEFREKLDRGRPERLGRMAVAFANTKGGTIVFGVDDDHRLVGCTIKGMADDITNILRSYCDPSPTARSSVVTHQHLRTRGLDEEHMKTATALAQTGLSGKERHCVSVSVRDSVPR